MALESGAEAHVQRAEPPPTWLSAPDVAERAGPDVLKARPRRGLRVPVRRIGAVSLRR